MTKENRVAVQATQVSYSAPLPEAGQFEHYNNVLPGAADRILSMAEKQSAHRQKIEKWVVVGDVLRSCFGLFFGFLIALVGLGGAVFLLYSGKSITGLSLAGGVLASLVSSFIYSSHQKKRELRKRKEEID